MDFEWKQQLQIMVYELMYNIVQATHTRVRQKHIQSEQNLYKMQT